MAYVRKTDTLIQDIKRKVRVMKQSALNTYDHPTPEIGTPLYKTIKDDIIKAAYASAPELLGKLPDDMLKKCESVRVKFFRDWHSETETKEADVDFHSASHDRFYLPYSRQTTSSFPCVYSKIEQCSPETQAWVAEELSLDKKRIEAISKFENIEYQIVNYMDQHASLNTAVKDMPELELYVPSHYVTKLHAANEPRTAKKQKVNTAEALDIDVNVLASAAIAHRITSSN